jgi:hypothetical protein
VAFGRRFGTFSVPFSLVINLFILLRLTGAPRADLSILQLHNTFRRERVPVLSAGHVLVQPICIAERILNALLYSKMTLRGDSCRPRIIISTLCGTTSVATMSQLLHESTVDHIQFNTVFSFKVFSWLGGKRQAKRLKNVVLGQPC